MLGLKMLGGFLRYIQEYGPTTSVPHQEFMEEISDALRRSKNNKSTILLGDFNAHLGIGLWRGVIGLADMVILALMPTEGC